MKAKHFNTFSPPSTGLLGRTYPTIPSTELWRWTPIPPYWPAFSDQELGQLEPMYYLGRRNSRSMCGNLDYCPPSDCHDFSHNCWVYMSGGWYALSLKFAKWSILNRSYAASHSVGYEDLTVGTWISHYSPEASVVHAVNGQFFCHSSCISGQHIRDMQFPRNSWLWFSKVSCLGHSDEVKWPDTFYLVMKHMMSIQQPPLHTEFRGL